MATREEITELKMQVKQLANNIAMAGKITDSEYLALLYITARISDLNTNILMRSNDEETKTR